MKKYHFKLGIAALFSAMIMLSCSEQRNGNVADIQFRLTDAPGEYQQVNIDIQAVNVIVDDSLIELSTFQGVYNLLEFVNGKDTLLVDDESPSGYISQIRLVLGEENTIMVDSVLHDLKTPSAQQSGLKLNIHSELLAGESYSFIIDFVVDKSIVAKGNGSYSLKPVIRVFTEAITGSIEGVVDPPDSRPMVRAMSETDTASTLSDTMNGAFMIRGLPAGIYSLDIESIEGFIDTLINDIEVVAAQTTVLDTIFLDQ